MCMPSHLWGCVEIGSAHHAYTSVSGARARGKERGGMKERGELRGQEAKQQYIGQTGSNGAIQVVLRS